MKNLTKATIATILTAIAGSGIYYYFDIQPVEPVFPVVINMSKTDFANLKGGFEELGVPSDKAQNLTNYFEGKGEMAPDEFTKWLTACNDIRGITGITNWGQINNLEQFIKKCNYLIAEVYRESKVK
jgi:hypothetical protein